MRVFFSNVYEQGVSEKGVDALDIVTPKYIVRIRISGIAVYKQGLSDPILDEEIDLTDETNARRSKNEIKEEKEETVTTSNPEGT